MILQLVFNWHILTHKQRQTLAIINTGGGLIYFAEYSALKSLHLLGNFLKSITPQNKNPPYTMPYKNKVHKYLWIFSFKIII